MCGARRTEGLDGQQFERLMFRATEHQAGELLAAGSEVDPGGDRRRRAVAGVFGYAKPAADAP